MKSRPKTAVRPATGKKGAVKKKKAEPIVYNYPLINYEELMKVPLLTIEIRIASAKADGSPLIETQVPLDTTLYKVVQIINEKHNNSLKNVRLYLGKEDASNKTGNLNAYMYKSFADIPLQDNKRFVGGETIKLYYDFDGCHHPLLEASFSI